jgi:hypothetical protein
MSARFTLVKRFLLAALFSSAAIVSAANAGTFVVTYTGADGLFDMQATIDATYTGSDDAWLVTSITGTVRGSWSGFTSGPESVTGLIPGGPNVFTTPSGAFIVDNVVYPVLSAEVFDNWGLAFNASGAEWNLFGNGAGQPYSLYTCEGGCYASDRGTVALTTVPETSTWIMMALGFAGLAFAGYRFSRKSVSIVG